MAEEMSSPDKTPPATPDLEVSSFLLEVVAAIIPIAVPDPAVASIGILSAFAVAAGSKGVLGRRQRRRLEALEQGMREMAEQDLPVILERLVAVEQSAALALLAISESIQASLDLQAISYGRLLAYGVVEHAEREADFVLRSIARLGELELLALLEFHARSVTGMTFSADGVVSNVVAPHLIKPIVASLNASGLIARNPGRNGHYMTELGTRVAKEMLGTGGVSTD